MRDPNSTGLAMNVLRNLRRVPALAMRLAKQLNNSEQQPLMLGRLLAEATRARGRIDALADVEFKVFSQFGDDGIIQWLVHHLQIPQKTFIEFGVEDYRESNTRFLMRRVSR